MAEHNLYTKIFRQLKGYLISPKLNVWRQLRKRLFSTDFPDNISQLKDYSKEPPSELYNSVLEAHERMRLDSKFDKLKDFEIAPEVNAFENIISIIEKEKNKQPGIIRQIPFYKKMIAAAALIIVLACCFFLLSTNETRQNEQSYSLANTGNALPDTTNSIDTLTGGTKNILLVNNTVEQLKYKSYSYKFNSTNFLSFSNVIIDGKEAPVEYNDLLYSFTKFPFIFGQSIPWDDRKGTVVKLNSYSNISVSPYMSSVIGDLYKVKRNGKPSWKAKKAKAKINRWRKNDVKKFDKKKNRNPLDIIDLGENVY